MRVRTSTLVETPNRLSLQDLKTWFSPSESSLYWRTVLMPPHIQFPLIVTQTREGSSFIRGLWAGRTWQDGMARFYDLAVHRIHIWWKEPNPVSRSDSLASPSTHDIQQRMTFHPSKGTNMRHACTTFPPY